MCRHPFRPRARTRRRSSRHLGRVARWRPGVRGGRIGPRRVDGGIGARGIAARVSPTDEVASVAGSTDAETHPPARQSARRCTERRRMPRRARAGAPHAALQEARDSADGGDLGAAASRAVATYSNARLESPPRGAIVVSSGNDGAAMGCSSDRVSIAALGPPSTSTSTLVTRATTVGSASSSTTTAVAGSSCEQLIKPSASAMTARPSWAPERKHDTADSDITGGWLRRVVGRARDRNADRDAGAHRDQTADEHPEPRLREDRAAVLLLRVRWAGRGSRVASSAGGR